MVQEDFPGSIPVYQDWRSAFVYIELNYTNKILHSASARPGTPYSGRLIGNLTEPAGRMMIVRGFITPDGQKL